MTLNPDHYLTDADKQAIEAADAAREEKIFRRRAKAIQEFLHLAEQLGFDDEKTGPVVESLRTTEDRALKKLIKAFGRVTTTLNATQVSSLEEESVASETKDKDDLEVADESHPEVIDLPEEATQPQVEIEPEEAEVSIQEQIPENLNELVLTILTRFTKVKIESFAQLTTTDPEEIIDHIASALPPGRLTDMSRQRFRALFAPSVTSYQDVERSKSLMTNVSTALKQANGNEKLAALLVRTDETEQPIGDTVEPKSDEAPQKVVALAEAVAEPKVRSRPVSRPVPRPPVAQLTYATDRPVRNTNPEKDEVEEILTEALEKPVNVSHGEWETAAELKLLEVSEGKLTIAQRDALWGWIHFDDEGNTPEELSKDGLQALNILQSRFFVADKDYFNANPYQNVAARTLVITANGIKDLPFICDKIAQLKSPRANIYEPHAPKITKHVAQRHVVAAVTHLLEETV